MGKSWKYHNGTWSEIEESLEWHEDEDLNIALKRAGFQANPMATYGDAAGSPAIDVYGKKDEAPPYLIFFSFGDNIWEVLVDDLPSLMQWLRDYAPFFLLEKVAYLIEELQTIGEKGFRAWHGHDYQNVCPTCDPIGWKRNQEWLREREKAKKLKGGQ